MKSSEKVLKDLEEYGYSLFRVNQTEPNDLLLKVLLSLDDRVLEAFPVVVASTLVKDDNRLNLARVHKQLRSESSRRLFLELVGHTLDLLHTYGLNDLADKLHDHLKRHRLLNAVRTSLRSLNVRRGRLDPERLRVTFVNYFLLTVREQRAKERQRVSEEYRQENYLSLLFSPKQKELVMKKLRGEKLSKTEREYFSRVVKKRLLALADPDVHRLVLKALQA